MNLQILSIVIYGENDRRRIVPFNVGKVNIITGRSYRGKSSLIDIVDYCLGSGEFLNEVRGYGDEATHQVRRLESINLFRNPPTSIHQSCPLCDQEMMKPNQTSSDLLQLLNELNENLSTAEQDRPQITEYIGDLKNKREALQINRQEIQNSIDVLIRTKNELQQIRDLKVKSGFVIGRISFFLESYTEFQSESDLRRKYDQAVDKLKSLESMYNSDEKELRVENAASIISSRMMELAKDLIFEHNKDILRFDPKRLTVYVNTLNEIRALSSIGSAANWVSLHLITLLSLQEYFIAKDRPVPAILFLDQTIQAYYQPDPENELDKTIIDEDRLAVRRIYELVFKVVAASKGNYKL